MKAKLLTYITLLFCTININAQCTISNLNDSGQDLGIFNDPIGQSFVAECSGYIEYIDVIAATQFDTLWGGDLNIFIGDNVGVTPYYTTSFPIMPVNSKDTIRFYFPLNECLLDSNEQYTFEFISTVYLYLNYSDEYSGGKFYFQGTSYSEYDLIFNVSVHKNDISIIENNSNLELSIFPNPISNNLIFNSIGEQNEKLTFQIINIEGEIMPIAGVVRDKTQCKINVEHLKEGMYFFIVSDGTSKKAMKFIKI